MIASEPRKCRDIEQKVTSGPHHPIHLIERCRGAAVVERVDDVEGRHDVELAVGEGQCGRGRLGDRSFAFALRVGETAVSQVDAGRFAEAPQHAEVVPRAAAAIENPRVASFDRARGFFEQGPHETTETMKPKVLALGARRHFEKSIHVQSAPPGRIHLRGELDEA